MDTKYSDDVINKVFYVYVIAVLIWIILIYALDLYQTDLIGKFILFIPIAIFIISMVSFENCEIEIENEIFQYDMVAFGVVIVTVFLTMRYARYTTFFYKLIFVGILLLGLSMFDVWIPRRNLIIAKHIRGILQTMSSVIFIYIFYTFYFISHHNESISFNPFVDVVDGIKAHKEAK
jgi:hypothetical protein